MEKGELFLLFISVAVIIAVFYAIIGNGISAYIKKKSIKYALRVAFDTIWLSEYEFYHKYR